MLAHRTTTNPDNMQPATVLWTNNHKIGLGYGIQLGCRSDMVMSEKEWQVKTGCDGM